ncbi:MAG: UDP-N-acetylmuramoyl-L-alanyl-D-glutamate--2,6-diaminopimelate ligase [Bdellovibrionales bacterium]
MQLLSFYPQLRLGQGPEREIKGLTNDSRQVQEGWVYVAIRGNQFDGHKFIPQVCASGAAALIVEDDRLIPKDYQGAVVVVESTRAALDQLAARYFGQPAEKLFCVGVTGTNGKTSTTYMVEAILNRFGWPTGVLGTINHHFGEHVWDAQLTTPDPLVLQKRLAEFRALGAGAVAFEVSSHALTQNRVDQLPFDVAVFTNLTRDHLDYHHTMEEYFAAKERLFHEVLATSSKPRTWAVVNADDPWSARLKIADQAKLWTYGQKAADFRFTLGRQDFTGSEFNLKTPRGEQTIHLPLPGLHNVYNATAAIAVGLAAGASLETCAQAIAEFNGVPGRLERVPDPGGLNIFVDYAHTDDALKVVLNALNEVRRLAGLQNRIITVFGCGGDRDKGKRPLMAQAAVAGSDLVFVTSDNPRTEKPEAIIADCVAGLAPALISNTVFTEVDRGAAIGRALQSAQTGDVILIAGKGHEDYQIVGTEKRPFSDGEVVREWLKANRK